MKTTLLQQLLKNLRLAVHGTLSARQAVARSTPWPTTPSHIKPEHTDIEMFNEISPISYYKDGISHTSIRGATLTAGVS